MKNNSIHRFPWLNLGEILGLSREPTWKIPVWQTKKEMWVKHPQIIRATAEQIEVQGAKIQNRG